jgi:hypothetical protein
MFLIVFKQLPETYKWWYFAIMAAAGAILSRILFMIKDSNSPQMYKQLKGHDN